MAEQHLEDLSTQEISALYKKTLAEAQKQRGFEQAQVQASGDLGIDGEYYKDQFGNIIPGKKPPVKRIETFVDSSGYVQELREGEKPPISQGTTMLDRVTAFVNANAEDPDVKELLPEDLSVFERQSEDFSDYYLLGTLRGKKWYVTALNEKDDTHAFKFVLANDLDRESAIIAARNYLETRVGPKFRELNRVVPEPSRLVSLRLRGSSFPPSAASANRRLLTQFLKAKTTGQTAALTEAYNALAKRNGDNQTDSADQRQTSSSSGGSPIGAVLAGGRL